MFLAQAEFLLSITGLNRWQFYDVFDLSGASYAFTYFHPFFSPSFSPREKMNFNTRSKCMDVQNNPVSPIRGIEHSTAAGTEVPLLVCITKLRLMPSGSRIRTRVLRYWIPTSSKGCRRRWYRNHSPDLEHFLFQSARLPLVSLQDLWCDAH